MASMQEIRSHIHSVQETRKITNAMYLISSNNLRKARKQLNDVKPYFQRIENTISDILHRSPEMMHPYLDPRFRANPEKGSVGYVVITGDKGLAGAYNHNVLKLAEAAVAEKPNCRLFVVGQVGVSWFRERKIPVQEFEFSAQNPTMHRAREIGAFLTEEYREERLDALYAIYTEMVTPLTLEARTVKLLPLDRDTFPWKPDGRSKYIHTVTYVPSEAAVLMALVPRYVNGMVFSLLVESFCSEQQARMTAMDNSTKNAADLIRQLNLQYNRARQAAITQEITEVVGGAQASSQ